VDSPLLITRALFAALAIVMFGLGLSLRLGDFKRLLGQPRAVTVALLLQVVLLPAACWGIALAFKLSPLHAVGLMLLAASPGGISANLFSHLFGGNVALNISLTAVNTLLSIVSLPLIANAAIQHFAGGGQLVPVQLGKLMEVVALVLLPVLLGMAAATRWPGFAARMEKPVKVFSAAVLATVTVLAIAKEWAALVGSFAQLGPAVLAFNLLSLGAGYTLSRAVGLAKPLAIAVGYEIGIHNATLALFIALNVLGSFEAALPAAVYSVVMYLTAPVFGWWVAGRSRPAPAAA
jgi:bile acid:Na+ symporter, BASS family